MAEVLAKTEYVLTVTHQEFRLIGLALSGKLKGKDTLAAMELNVKLLSLKEKFVADLAAMVAGQSETARQELEELKARKKLEE